jgi:hypothetical protein
MGRTIERTTEIAEDFMNKNNLPELYKVILTLFYSKLRESP